MAACLAGVAVIHATCGYLDTLSADGVRRISPAEQHVHSLLDRVPWIFLVWIATNADHSWDLRWAPAKLHIWLALVIPSLLLVVAPWAMEFSRTVAYKRGHAQRGE